MDMVQHRPPLGMPEACATDALKRCSTVGANPRAICPQSAWGIAPVLTSFLAPRVRRTTVLTRPRRRLAFA
eukprot:4827302-Alexandrium_andersonii.AAC.1